MNRDARKIVTCIGWRKTPPDMQDMMFKMGYVMAQKGNFFRYGGASGPDLAFQNGAERFCRDSNLSPSYYQRVYLPHNGFNGLKENAGRGIIDFQRTANYNKAISIARKFYRTRATSGWPDWMQNLMGRNTYQILGEDLQTLSSCVICYTKDGSLDGRSKTSGGTGQALRIARFHNVPIFNLQREDHLNYISDKLKLT